MRSPFGPFSMPYGDHLARLLRLRVVEAAAHQALHRVDRVLRVDDRLALGRDADQPLAVLVESDDGRRRAVAFGIGDHGRVAAFHDGDNAVGGAQVNADNFTHDILMPPSCFGSFHFISAQAHRCTLALLKLMPTVYRIRVSMSLGFHLRFV
jgi:hypothetical protein